MSVRVRQQGAAPVIPPPTEEIIDLGVQDEQTEQPDLIPEPSTVNSFKMASATKERKIPPFPSKKLQGAQGEKKFFEWMDSLEEEDFVYLIFYVYRTWPVIDRRIANPDAPVNIDKIGSKFTKETILAAHGSGDYKVLATNSNNAYQGKGSQMGEIHFSWREPGYPPKVVLSELIIDDRLNRTFVDRLKAEGKLTDEGRIKDSSGGSMDPSMIGLLRDMVTRLDQKKDATGDNIGQMYVKANETMVGMLKEQMKSDDPDKWMKMMALMKELIPKPENNNSMLELILKLQTDAQARESVLMGKMFELLANKGSGDSEIDRILKYKELGIFGSDEGPKAKRSTTEVVIEAVSPLVGKAADVILSLLTLKNYQAGQARQPQAPVQPAEPMGLPPVQQPEPKENVIEMPTQQSDQDRFSEMLKGPAGQMILGALNRGETGDTFAGSVETMLGPIAYDQIANAGKEGIIGAMKATPEFWQHVASIEPTVERFVEQFIKYGQDEEESEGE